MAVETWDTEEVESWIENDEYLLKSIKHLVKRDQLTKTRLKKLYVTVVDNEGFTKVDLDRVDWTKLVEVCYKEFS